MKQWCVTHVDERQDKPYVNGPFSSYDLACAWAGRFAQHKATEYGMKLEGENDYFAIMTDSEEMPECVAEISVIELIPPHVE